MDITLEIFNNYPTGPVTGRQWVDAVKYINGDIHRIYCPMITLPNVSASKSPFVWIHIVGIPDQITCEKIHEVFKAVSEADTAIFTNEFGEQQQKRMRNSKFNFRISRLNPPDTNELLTNKQLTITFNRAKQLLNRKAIIDAYNNSLDQEGADLSDGDFI